MDLNKVMLIGRLTRDPELRTIPSGQTVASFSVATGRQWTDQSGQKQEKTEFHNIIAWRRLADIAGQYLKKGQQIYVEGRLETKSWDDQTGNKKYRTEVIAENFIMLGGRPAGAAASAAPAPAAYQKAQNNPSAQNFTAPANPKPSQPAAGSNIPSDEDISVEDIPF